MSLLIEHRGPVAVLTLNRPEKLNALNNQLISALTAALDEMELDRSVRAIKGPGRPLNPEQERVVRSAPAPTLRNSKRI